MLRRRATAAVALSLAASFGAPAAANPRHINGYDARRGGIVIPNGKVVPLSGIWTTTMNARSRAQPPAARSLNSADASRDVLVTHIDGPFPANEPAIAIDPNNPEHLIGSANDYRLGGDGAFALYSSRNGGASWTDKNGQWVNSYPSYFQSSGDPAVAIDHYSIDYFQTLSFNRSDNSNAVVIARSTPGEADLFVDQFPVLLNAQGPASTLFNDKDALTVDNVGGSPTNGSLYSTWTLFDNSTAGVSPIVEAYSRDQGMTFSGIELVSKAGGSALCSDGGACQSNQGSSPAVGPGGTLYVAYENFDTTTVQNQIFVSASTDGGQTFGTPHRVAADYDISNPYNTASNTSFRVDSFPNLAVNPKTGQLYIAWADERDGSAEIYVSTSKDKAVTWSKPQAVTPPYYGAFRFFPAIGVQASTGDVYVSYYDNKRYATRDVYDYYYVKGSADLKPLRGATLASTTPIVPALAFFGGSFFGDYTELATSPLGANLMWTGTRSGQQDIESTRVP